MSVLCSIVGASFTVAAAAEVLRSKKGITAVGNAQVSTAQSQFGGASALFDGSGDYLIASPGNNFTTENFTIEFWVRFVSTGANQLIASGYPAGSPNLNWAFWMGASNTFQYFLSSTGNTWNIAEGITIGTVTTNTWYHVALVRNGTTFTPYLNGVAGTTSTSSNSLYFNNTNFYIGGNASNVMNGHIDEFRISNSARYTANFTAPTTAFVNDANTLLLIHADGTNASTFFEDDNGVRAPVGLSATSTVVTSTTQSKFGGTSIYFPETSGQQLLVGPGAPNAGSGDFTIEGWVYFTKLPGNGDSGYMMWVSSSPEPYILFNNTQIGLGAGGYPAFTRTGGNWPINTWIHIAVVRNSGTLRCYENGVEFGTAVTGSTYNYTAFGRFGKFGDDRGRWQGYMDEFRVSNIARYTSNFTPSTQPFVNDANTLLLIHADGTNNSTVFVDDNGTTSRYKLQTLPVNDVVISTAQSKFGGSSALFDGDGDHLITYNFPNDDIVGDFTLELWARFDILPATQTIGGGAYMMIYNCTTAPYIFVANNGSNNPQVSLGFDPDYPNYIHTGKTISTNTWYHIAVVRSNGIIRCYWDGSDMGSPSTGDTANLAKHNPFESQIMWGKWHNTRGVWDGYMDEIRISKVARYTSNFTPSASAFTLDDNTLLLLHMDGENNSTVFTDDATVGKRYKKGITAIGNAQISTAQSQFGGSSALFDGTGDYIQLSNSSDYNFGPNNFTIECWVRATNFSSFPSIMGMATIGTYGGWTIQFNTSGVPFFQCSTNNSSINITPSGPALSTATWSHIAVVRDGNSIRVYKDGVGGTAVTITGSIITSTANLIFGDGYGVNPAWVAAQDFNGYLDEIRISNTARYTANFTAPTQPFQNDANTVLLIHCDGTNASTVFTDDNGQIPFIPS
jgi:hypothetical protein